MAAKFAAVMAIADAGSVTLNWDDCGDADTHVVITDISPTKLALPGSTTITGTGLLDEDATAGQFKFDAKLAGVSILKDGGSLCEDKHIVLPLNGGTIDVHGINCPVAPGEISVKLDINLLDSPAVSNDLITIDLSALTDKGDKLLCAALSVEQPATLTSEVADMCYLGDLCFKDQHPAMAIVQAHNPDMCCESCNADPSCAGWVWKDAQCHLKANPDYVKTGCNPADGVNCFMCQMSTRGVTRSVAKPEPLEQPATLTSEVEDMCYLGGLCFKDQHPAMAIAQANGPDSCCLSCNADPSCAGWVWKDGKCHLKANPDYVKTGCTGADGVNCFMCQLSTRGSTLSSNTTVLV